jgi:hypothetical protein
MSVRGDSGRLQDIDDLGTGDRLVEQLRHGELASLVSVAEFGSRLPEKLGSPGIPPRSKSLIGLRRNGGATWCRLSGPRRPVVSLPTHGVR